MQNIKTFMDFIWPFSYIGFSILNRIKKEETNIEAFAAMSEENSELINKYKNNLYIVKTPKKGGIGLNDSLKNICKLAKSLSNKEDVSDLTKEICY